MFHNLPRPLTSRPAAFFVFFSMHLPPHPRTHHSPCPAAQAAALGERCQPLAMDINALHAATHKYKAKNNKNGGEHVRYCGVRGLTARECVGSCIILFHFQKPNKSGKQNIFTKFCSRFSSRYNHTHARDKPNKAAGQDTTAPRGSTAPRGTARGGRALRESGPHSNTAQGEDDRKHATRHPRVHTEQSTTADDTTWQHTTAKHTQRGGTRQNTAPEGTGPKDDGKRPRTQHSARQHQTEQNETTQRTITQPQAAQRAATRSSTEPRDTPQHATETRHQEPPGPTRTQQRTARPNSKHTNTTGNNRKHQPALRGQESTEQRATTQAHQHSTAQVEHRNRNDLEPARSPEPTGNNRKPAPQAGRKHKKKTGHHSTAPHGSTAPQDTS